MLYSYAGFRWSGWSSPGLHHGWIFTDTDSGNYIGITVSSVMGKILDSILFSTNMKVLNSSHVQFK